MDDTTLERDDQDFIEISRTTSGQVTFKVHINRDPAASMELTRQLAEAHFDALNAKYPTLPGKG